ncbi:MAG: hypothetical protein ACJ79A_08700 [Gemmatimonadaceae bacterium]
MAEPAPGDVEWLSSVATRGDVDHARWELRYLHRSIGILVAQRDALDDRTPSEVLRALLDRMHKDPNVDPSLRELAERQFNARLGAYRDAFASRGRGTPALRLAQNMLAFAGGPIRGDDPVVQRGADIVAETIAAANDALRASFGEVELPEDVSPSRLAR